MNAQSTPATDEEIWEELLNSKASRKFLAEQVRKAEEILKKDVFCRGIKAMGSA